MRDLDIRLLPGSAWYRAGMLLTLLLLAGCGGDDSGSMTGPADPDGAPRPAASKDSGEAEVPDDALRVILRPQPVAFLPRNAEPVRIDRDIAEGLAANLNRPYHPMVVEDYGDMIDRLLDGEGDIIAASMTVTEDRASRVLFSVPYDHVDELLIVPAGEAAAAQWSDLDGRVICVRRASSYAETLRQLQEDGVQVQMEIQPEDSNTEEIVDRVANGDCPATLVDSHYWNSIRRYFDDLQALRALAENRPIALAMRPDAQSLKKLVDQYLTQRALTGRRDSFYSDDLPGLKKRQRLRLITRNSATTYYLYRGAPYGFEYELVNRFAEQQGLRLDIVIPDDNESLLPALNEGRGDIVGAMLTVTPERRERAAFTRPYFYDDEVVVTREDDNLETVADLAGRTVHVRRSSSYYQTSRVLQEQVPELKIEFAPEEMATEQILQRIASGEWDLTISNLDLV